jgi:hypothetical protein
MNTYESVSRAKLCMSLEDARNQLIWLRKEHPEEKDLVEALRKLRELMIILGPKNS